MKSMAAFLSQLRSLGIKLWLEGKNLRFKAPKGVFTKQLKAQLVAHKADVIDFIREADTAQKQSSQMIRAETRPEQIPLSFAQQRLWFLHRLEPSSHAYNMPMPLHLRGKLEVAAFKAACDELVHRHESLRTTFYEQDEQPYQRIGTAVDVFSEIDLSGCYPERRESQLAELVSTYGTLCFDLEHGPLLRVYLISLDRSHHVLLVNMHHIISDGWSQGIFLHEVCLLYETYTQRRVPNLPPVEIQYADYALWQREWLQGDQLEQHLRYWRTQLAGDLPPLEPVPDHPRPAYQGNQGSRQSDTIADGVLAKIEHLSQALGATQFMVLVAAFKTLMMRYTGQSDIIIGTPIANRNRAETEAVFGCFVNTLALRSQLAGNPSFSDLVVQVSNMMLDAYAHQDLPFEQIVADVQPTRDLSRSPIFQVMFSVDAVDMSSPQLTNLQLEPLITEIETAKFDLDMSITTDAQTLSCSLHYNTDLYEGGTIRQILAHFKNLLKAITANPHQTIEELELMEPAELEHLLITHNQEPELLTELTTHQLFEGQVQRTPERIALMMDDGRRYSYEALNRRANQLAHYLRWHGVTRERAVGLYLLRTPEMAIAQIAALKSGGVYLPLASDLPQERLAFMLQDSCPAVIVTHAAIQALPSQQIVKICLDRDEAAIEACFETNPSATISPDNTAYTIYTSGSTGVPKGVLLSHRALANHMLGTIAEYQLNEDSTLFQFASFNFDASLEQFWPALVVGGKVVMRGPEIIPPHQFCQKMLDWELTHLDLTPAYWLQVVREWYEQERTELAQLNSFAIGGDAMPPEALKLWQMTALNRTNLFNGYGPTEATVASTSFHIPKTFKPGRHLPIGKPLDNRTCYILGKNGNPTPFGVPGELAIGGPLLARGYLNRAPLTAQQFIPDPYGSLPGSRLYKSGDLVRFGAEENILFLGRVDQQVKVRGFRIELLEVEAVLGQHDQVSESVVLAPEDHQGQKFLAAYLVPKEPQAESAHEALIKEVAEWIKDKLPSYMAPTSYIVLPNLPLNTNGKLDRKSLPKPDPGLYRKIRQFEKPRNDMETRVAEIYAQLLGREQIGIHDHFFELGGHSLLATQAISRLSKQLSMEVELRLIFEVPTVKGLAAALQQAAHCALPAIEARVRDGQVIPLSFAQQRLWFLDQLSPGNPHYNMPAALHIKGPLDIRALQAALVYLSERHESLRTTFNEEDGIATQCIACSVSCSLPLIDLQGHSNPLSQARLLAASEARLTFLLDQGPLLRVRLLRLDHLNHALTVTMHHIISDGWSLDLFIREIVASYRAALDDKPAPFPPLAIQYADFAIWQRNLMGGYRQQQQMDYWRTQLSGELPVLEPVPDHRRPPQQGHRGARQSRIIADGIPAKMAALGGELGATPFMVYLAAFKVMMMRYTGQTDIIIGTPIANRNRVETEAVIGFFVNTLALRTRLDRHARFRELVASVRHMTLDAYAHQDLPFEQIVAEIQPERDLSRSAIFQNMFTVEIGAVSKDVSRDELAGLELEPLRLTQEMAKFDLSMSNNIRDESLFCSLNYNTDLYEPETIQRMLAHYENLLRHIVAEPNTSLGNLQLLGVEEQRQLLQTHYRNPEPYTGQTVIEKFEAQVERTPEHIALSMEGEPCYSYRELNRRANQLAQHLREHGVTHEQVVGLYLHRTPAMAVAQVATFKSGGVYLPLVPDLPQERIAAMIQDSGCLVIISQNATDPGTKQTIVVDLDRDAPAIEARAEGNPNVPMSPQNLAYLLYTSGTTGKPKGVQLTHGTFASHIQSTVDLFNFGTHSCIYQFTAFNFDPSLAQYWSALVCGARVEMRGQNLPDPHQLTHKILAWGLTHLGLTPAYWQQLVEAWYEQGLTNIGPLQTCSVGGEVMPPESLKRWQQTALNRAKLYNAYGPTETVITSTLYPIPKNSQVDGPLPIGKPYGNRTHYIFDQSGNPVPSGAPGQLMIGGLVARGYHKRPGLTAQQFVPDSYEKGGRLYQSGDLARNDRDGNLVYLGRADQQIKLRGYRIELLEIEAVMAQHERVAESAVLAPQDPDGQRRLEGYLVPTRECNENECQQLIEEVRQWLKGKLPSYMIPSTFNHLQRMPLNASGKLDRRALAKHGTGQEHRPHKGEPPRNEMEAMVAQIYGELLDRTEIGIDDHFFELGGHSLLATQAVSRLRKQLNRKVELRHIFEAPTVQALATALDQQGYATGKQEQPITARPRDGKPIPLSYAQQRLWFLERLSPGGSHYNMPMPLLIKGPLDIGALQTAYHAMEARHESLRTTFSGQDGQAAQKIAEPLQEQLALIDLQGLGDPQQQAQLLAAREAWQPYQLERGPLHRIHLIRVGVQTHALTLNMHHIISDGWSMNIYMREMVAYYQAALDGKPSPFPELTIQYADISIWQRARMQGALQQQHLNYWRPQLAGDLPHLEPVPDHPRPALQGYQGASQSHTVGEGIAAKMAALGYQLSATPFMIYLAAFKVLMMRYTGQDDIIIGTPIANRNRAETEAVIGMFVNTLALRSRVEGKTRYREFVKQVRGMTLEAYTHQDLPFEQIVAELQLIRDLSRTPIFQVMFAVETIKPNPAQAGLQIEPLTALEEHTGLEEPTAEIAKFDLDMSIAIHEATLKITLTYNTDLYEHATIRRMLGHYKQLLISIADDPQQTNENLTLNEPAELQALLAEHNQEPARQLGQGVHHLFEAQVGRTPDRIALMMDDGCSISYQDLNRRANQLAHHLRHHGVRREQPVGLYLQRTLEMAIAQIATYKAGGVYVPIEPNLPQQRIAYMLKDSGAAVVVTHDAVPQSMTEQQLKMINLDRDEAAIGACSGRNLTHQHSPEQLAYVIYTSGTTGQPKGVMLSYGALARHLLDTVHNYQFDEDSIAYQFASYNFDASLEQYWPALLVGGRVVMRGREITVPRQFIQKILAWKVTHLDLTPAYWHQIVREWHDIGQTDLARLRIMNIGGDVMPHEGLKKWQETALNQIELINGYGPTEATVCTTIYRIPKDFVPGRQIPIGRPLPNRTSYIQDKQGRLVPYGVPGELVIGGPLLARGYHNRPGLTAQQFVPDRYARESGSRHYKSGDLVRYATTGDILYLGRIDQQIKIRGYRIELLEIEAVLKEQACVREAIVLAPEDQQGQKFLAAYLVPDERECDQNHLITASREWTKHKLPNYMQPTAYSVLESIPLNANGKIDRAALPKVRPDQQQLRSEMVGPRNQAEVQLLSCWREVLADPSLGIHDDFFEQGGHSMAALRLLGLIEKHMQEQLTVTQIFQAPTVSKMAQQLEAKTREASILVPLKPTGAGRPWFFVHPIGGQVHWYFEMAQAMKSPFYGIQSPHPDKAPATLTALASQYIEQLKTQQAAGPYLLGGWSIGGAIAFEMAHQLERSGERVDQLVLLDAWRLDREELVPQDRDKSLRHFIEELTGGMELGIDQHLSQRAGREDTTLLVALHEQLQGKGLIPANLPINTVTELYRTYTHNAQLVADGPQITQYEGEVVWIQATTSVAARQARGGKDEPSWQDNCKKELTIVQVTGDHYTILTREHVSETVAILEQLACKAPSG